MTLDGRDPGRQDPLSTIAVTLRGEGGLLAAVVQDPSPTADRSLGDAVAAGPRAQVVGPDLALAAEATREAELLHHAPERARVIRTDDRDLALLAGDRLYALGLMRLAAGGWSVEVAILAQVVALVARVHAAKAWRISPDADTSAVWRAAAAALGHGSAIPVDLRPS